MTMGKFNHRNLVFAHEVILSKPNLDVGDQTGRSRYYDV